MFEHKEKNANYTCDLRRRKNMRKNILLTYQQKYLIKYLLITQSDLYNIIFAKIIFTFTGPHSTMYNWLIMYNCTYVQDHNVQLTHSDCNIYAIYKLIMT